MNNETSVLEKNYEMKISFITFFKDFFGTSKGDADVEKVENRVEEIKKSSDMVYIENLEKGMNPVIEKERKSKKKGIQTQNESVLGDSIEIKEATTEIKDNGENELSL